MINRKDHSISFFGSILFIIFFFLFLSSFSEKKVRHTNFAIQLELASELHSTTANATITDAVQLPSFQITQVSFLDKTNFRLFNENLKIFSDTRNQIQKIIVLQKIQLSIKPIPFYRFCYHLPSTDTEELPILS